MLQRVKEVQESDLRMDGALARNIQRVLAVTQAQIDTAAANGQSWFVKPVVKVNDPLDNLRGGTQLVIKQNSILPGQNVMRVMYVGGQAVVVGPGTSPLSLPGAMADDILSLTAFGGTMQGVPQGYTLLDYIESTGTQYLDLGAKGNGNTKVSVEFRYHTASSATGSGRVFGSRTNSTNNAFAIGSSSGVVGATGNKVFWCYDAQAFFVIDDPTFPIGDWQTVVFSAAEHTLNGVSYGDDYNVVEFETPQNLKLFGFDNGGTMGYGLIDVARCKLWDNGVLIRDLVPCKDASNVVGMYDLVNGVFYQNAGTGDFVAGTVIAPTPAAPIDIVCNNGVLKARHQSGLPTGYTLLDYIESNGTQYVDTGVPVKANTRVRAEFEFTSPTSSTRRLFGKIAGSSAGAMNYREYASFYWFQSNTVTTSSAGKHLIEFKTDDNVYLDGSVIGTKGTFGSGSNLPIYLFAELSDGGAINYGSVKVYRFTVFEDTAIVQDLVPCKNASNVVGMYDLVSGQFFTNQGTGDFVAGSTVSDPVEIYTAGPIETIATKDSNSSIVSTATTEMLLSVDTYTDQQEVIGGSITRKCGVVILDSSFEWTYDGAYGRVNATIPNLWGSTVARTVPGFCTHFKWLSHQESISSITAGQCYSASANRIFLHISQTSAAAFSAWLDAQKNAGTPVIIVFPLENATTDSVAGQPMQTAAGDNTAEITQAGMAGLELEVEYLKDE